MKKTSTLFALLVFAFTQVLVAQSAKELQENANTFLQQGDFSNAILLLNKANLLEPNSTELSKNLALAYYLQKDNTKALETIKPLLDKDDADDQCYQIAASIYLQQLLPKDAEKVFKKGIKKFAASGPLYNDYGEILWLQKDYNAIKQWEKGIEMDPSYSKNYYNACKYYYLTADKVWTIIYAEIFVNIEPMGVHTTEVKEILLDSYKKMFSENDITKLAKADNTFEKAFLQSMNKQSQVATLGINAETITMIRTRFILDWYENYAEKFPFKLFDMNRQFLQEGLFEAYNQWMFGAIQNLPAFQNWTNNNDAAYKEFSKMQKAKIFKLPTGQYYH
jgi:tetratricopeptide (TPR) repeat protein